MKTVYIDYKNTDTKNICCTKFDKDIEEKNAKGGCTILLKTSQDVTDRTKCIGSLKKELKSWYIW